MCRQGHDDTVATFNRANEKVREAVKAKQGFIYSARARRDQASEFPAEEGPDINQKQPDG